MAKGICSRCGEMFNSESAFDQHRYGSFGNPILGRNKRTLGWTPSERQCLTDIQMYTKGLMKNDRGMWVTSLYDGPFRSDQENATDVCSQP